jgi:hypothetical protein
LLVTAQATTDGCAIRLVDVAGPRREEHASNATGRALLARSGEGVGDGRLGRARLFHGA